MEFTNSGLYIAHSKKENQYIQVKIVTLYNKVLFVQISKYIS